MELKKAQNSSQEDVTSKAEQARDFITNIKSEVRHISWTSREDLITYTKIVVAMTFLFGMSIYFMDITIQTLLHGLNLILRFIGG